LLDCPDAVAFEPAENCRPDRYLTRAVRASIPDRSSCSASAALWTQFLRPAFDVRLGQWGRSRMPVIHIQSAPMFSPQSSAHSAALLLERFLPLEPLPFRTAAFSSRNEESRPDWDRARPLGQSDYAVLLTEPTGRAISFSSCRAGMAVAGECEKRFRCSQR
jgi:hypothetical protein